MRRLETTAGPCIIALRAHQAGKVATKLLSIELLDHVIVGHGRFVRVKELGALELPLGG
jgi:hypothetical protein